MLSFREEKMSDELTKYHVIGLPFDAVFHHFTGADKGDPHDHPFAFRSHVISGDYEETIYRIKKDGNWSISSHW